MKETLTAAGDEDFDANINKTVTVAAHGNAEDFTWEVHCSLDDGATYKALKDSVGNTEITGSDTREFLAPAELLRLSVTAMGAATSIVVTGNADR